MTCLKCKKKRLLHFSETKPRYRTTTSVFWSSEDSVCLFQKQTKIDNWFKTDTQQNTRHTLVLTITIIWKKSVLSMTSFPCANWLR